MYTTLPLTHYPLGQTCLYRQSLWVEYRLSNFWFSIKLGPLSTNKLKTGFASPSKQTQGFWAESVENIFV